MPSALFVLTLVSALGCAVAGGVLFAFSTFVMPALARVRDSEGIAAMQQINVKAINPLFMTALFGAGATCLAGIVVALASWGEPYAPYLVAAGVLYLPGMIGVTMLCNVPRNDALAQVDPSDAGAAELWRRYLVEWTAWNHVRVVAGVAVAALQIAAIHVG